MWKPQSEETASWCEVKCVEKEKQFFCRSDWIYTNRAFVKAPLNYLLENSGSSSSSSRR